MIAQKLETKQLIRKNENSSIAKRVRLSSKTGLSTSKTDPEAFSNSQTPAGSSPPNAPSPLYIGPPLEDSQLKSLEMISLTSAANTSKGVQNLIEQVSKFIEKKNPFKDAPEDDVKPDEDRSEAPQKDTTTVSNYKSSGKTTKSHLEWLRAVERTRRTSGGAQRSKSRTLISAGKGAQRGAVNSTSRVGKSEELRRMRRPLGGSAGGKREGEGKTSVKVVSPRAGCEDREKGKKPLSARQEQRRRAGRSEIPLRKTRTDLSKSPKPLSLLIRKPVEDAESTASINYFSKKPFTPIEELSLSSEQQKNNSTTSSERLSEAGNKTSPRTKRKDMTSDEASSGFKLDKCYKSPNIRVNSNSSLDDMSDKRLGSDKKSKVLDLSKVRTSSFTVLRTGREALCRLESLHQQNVSTKENAFGEKVSSSKLKLVAVNSTFNDLKGKNSKKNLTTRTSSKGNKPALKLKTKKSKKDIGEGLGSLKKPKTTLMRVETCVKAKIPRLVRSAAVTKEGLKSKQKSYESHSTAMPFAVVTKGSCKKETIPQNDSSASSTADVEDSDKESKYSTCKIIGKAIFPKDVEQQPSKERIEKPFERGLPRSVVLENSHCDTRHTDEDERSSSKTVTLEERLTDELSSVSSHGSQTQCKLAKKSSKGFLEGFVSKGTPLKCGKDEPPEKPEGLEPKKNKLHIKINFTPSEDVELDDNSNSSKPFDWMYLSNSNYGEERPPNEGGSNDLENVKEGKEKSDSIEDEKTDEEPVTPAVQKPRRSSPFVRTRPQYKVPISSLKSLRKKKIRSDAGDRRLPSAAGFFKSVALQNKLKLDTKLRSGLTKAYAREDKRDIFDDAAPAKLKRRNSEPISFRGYVWKRADSVTPRGHKASVSSMASSLKHLNTDDIDDFIFWEAVPQKMTSCWEMSLYHFKRPWSVLSCSVFEDNRQSSTPGLILENLRNGGGLGSRQTTLSSSERSTPKDNPFDVEPSIAQKNIDIRNWLAALNFPTPPSTSSDTIREGNFPTQASVDLQNVSKGQANQRRRKVLPGLRFSDEPTDNKPEEKAGMYKSSPNWKTNEIGGLMSLIRRKSGGFVTNEQFLSSEHSIHRPNVSANLCLRPENHEEKGPLHDTHDNGVSSEPKLLKSDVDESQSADTKDQEPSLEGTEPTAQTSEICLLKEEPEETTEEQKPRPRRSCLRELLPDPAELNVWKYLFLCTVFIIFVQFCYSNSSSSIMGPY